MVGASAAIPFRQDHGAATTTVTGALLATVLLLVVAMLVAWYARRRGWLDRWVGQAAPAMPKQTLRMEQALRLSPRTTLYRVRDGSRLLLVVESQVNARVVSIDGAEANGEVDEHGDH